MPKPDPPDDQQPEQGVAPDGSPSFEELMMLVFSGPMCFECLEEKEENGEAASADEFEDEKVEEQNNERPDTN